MNIVIIGMGEVGSHVAGVLIDEGHNVTIVDNNPSALKRAEELFDAATVLGHAGNPTILRAAGAAACDLFVAVTDHCELNIDSAFMARQLGANRTVARVMDPAYFEVERGVTADMLGIDIVINPLFQIAAEIRRLVRSRSAVAVQDFADHQIEMVQLPVEMDAPLIGRPLKDVRLPKQTIIAAILRGDDLIVPGGNDSILAGDEVITVGRTANVLEIERQFTRRKARFGRRAIIVGGGVIAVNVARALEADEFDVVLLERDRDRCRELVAELEQTVVLNADGTNSSLLEEEGVATADVFIAVSDEDEMNLMASLLARDLGAPRCIALVHRPDYAAICERLGIDATLSPRLTVAQQVLKYVREGEVVSVARVMQGRAEFVEFLVTSDSRMADTALRDAQLPRGALVCAVLNAEGAFVPDGSFVIRPDDQVVVFITPDVRGRVEKLFRRGMFGRGAS